jgi:hypothetical protein
MARRQPIAPAEKTAAAEPADPDQLTKAAQAQADRLSHAMAQAPPPKGEWDTGDAAGQDKPASKKVAKKVAWIETEKPGEAAERSAATDAAATVAAAANTAPVTLIAEGAKSPQAAARPALDRQALLDGLLKDIRASQDPAMAKAVSAAALALLDPDHQMADADLAGLSPEQREQVQRYHRAITLMGKQLALGDQSLSAGEVSDQLNQILGEPALHMKNVRLCRRVSGYGVYETFDSTTFLAGREQPVIVYAELENFHSTLDASNQFQVKLTQEIVLYNESDGLAVWKQPAAQIVDQSRNRRRDFFVVQLIRLPARLTVGKYRLKVRVNDLGGGSIDEATVPIQVVADQTLVAAPARR